MLKNKNIKTPCKPVISTLSRDFKKSVYEKEEEIKEWKNKENIDKNVWTIRNCREWLNHAPLRGIRVKK